MGILDRLLNTALGRNLISIVLGLGFATLFQRVCNDRNCLVFQGPIISDIEGKVFMKDDKCYVFKKKHVSCAPSSETDGTQIIDMAADNHAYAENKKPLEVAPLASSSSSSSTTPSPSSSSSETKKEIKK